MVNQRYCQLLQQLAIPVMLKTKASDFKSKTSREMWSIVKLWKTLHSYSHWLGMFHSLQYQHRIAITHRELVKCQLNLSPHWWSSSIREVVNYSAGKQCLHNSVLTHLFERHNTSPAYPGNADIAQDWQDWNTKIMFDMTEYLSPICYLTPMIQEICGDKGLNPY